MILEDYLAWLILALFYLASAIPISGSWATGFESNYKDDWKAGILIHAALSVLAIIVCSVSWAFVWVMK